MEAYLPTRSGAPSGTRQPARWRTRHDLTNAAFESLGGADHGWLKAKHHFSFAGYHDPKRMSWGAIRVWNDDEIAPQSGFPPHPAFADMEIITYVREGAITHQATPWATKAAPAPATCR